MARKLFIYTGIVIWHFEKAKKKKKKKKKNPEMSIFVTIFVEKCFFGYISLRKWNSAKNWSLPWKYF